MKILTILLAITAILHAEPARDWTDATTGRVIRGYITDKKDDASAVQIALVSGRTHWLETARLTAEDRDYIQKWIKPVKRLTVRVTGKGPGYKTITIKATGGGANIRVVVDRAPGGHVIIHELAPDETWETTVRVTERYSVKAYNGDNLVDEESWNKKSGL